MHHPSRPPNRPDGPTAGTATQGSGGDPPPAGAAGASAQTSGSVNGGNRSLSHSDSTGGREPDPTPWSRNPHSLGVFPTRSMLYHYRRASSGYFSFDGDSLPSSPRPPTADRATQTPSPTGQVIEHALQRMAEASVGGLGTHQQYGHCPSPSSMRPQNAAGDMQTVAIGRAIRQIGDNLDRLHARGVAGRHRPAGIQPNPLPHIHQEPTVLLCMGLLLLLIGRIIYLQGNTNSQDHSQV